VLIVDDDSLVTGSLSRVVVRHPPHGMQMSERGTFRPPQRYPRCMKATGDFKVECQAGRLVQARVHALECRADVDAYARAFELFRSKRPAPVLCADHRGMRVYPPDVADRLIAMFTNLNDLWERAVLVTSPVHAVLTMQLQRIIARSASSSRRVFSDTRAAEAFLTGALTAAERSSLHSFLVF